MTSNPTSSSSRPPKSPPAKAQPLVKKNQSLDEFLEDFWAGTIDRYEQESPDFKQHVLPLARIKKVMKMDEDVRMISAEAPIIFSRACELFISELTCRSYLVAEAGNRKTLQRGDIAKAVAGSDAFDFLCDIDVAKASTKMSAPGKDEQDELMDLGDETTSAAAGNGSKKKLNKKKGHKKARTEETYAG
ncbi:histone-fold-containing protein [Phaffia rhodozyma]|uniref:Histone-fold-containing protein n=1 Tax=Phaffia rhodozyma TaxID=264483 RepID=A0A0F7SKS0_PHARH|nr:histone-fold-containing protein [Phaffia rhodozyma]